MRDDSAPSWTWLQPNLVVGGRMGPGLTSRLLAEYGIAHVVDVRSEEQDDRELLHRHGVELLLLPTEDHCAVSEEMLASGVAWVTQRLARGGRVYIHCEHGIGRSVLLSWCVLVALGADVRAALEQIKRARACASPSPAQISAMLAFARPRVASLPSWEELAEIAYAHLRERDGERGAQ